MDWYQTFGINQMKHDKHGGQILCSHCAGTRTALGSLPSGVEIDSIDCVPDNIVAIVAKRDPNKLLKCADCGLPERYSTNGLTRYVRAKLIEHDQREKAGRVRSICTGDTDSIVKAVRTALKRVRPGDVRLVVRLHGGLVPNSYRYSPPGDRLVLTIDLTIRKGWDLEVERGLAQKRPHGRGELLTARLLLEGQTQGREGGAMNRWHLDEGGHTVVAMRKPVYIYIPVRLSDWLMEVASISRRKANKLLTDAYIHFGSDLGFQSGENYIAWHGNYVGPYCPPDYDEEGQLARDEAEGTLVYRDEDGNPATDFGIRWEV